MDTRPIAVFDSGIGGLSVMESIASLLPSENIVYFGDNSYGSFGDQSYETLFNISKQFLAFSLKINAKTIAIACNTLSSVIAQSVFTDSLPTVFVANAGVESAVATSAKSVLVLATPATVKSYYFRRQISCLRPELNIIQMPCRLFAPLVEEGLSDTEIARLVSIEYLNRTSHQYDTIVLGCTHYSFLKESIRSADKNTAQIIDPSVATAIKLKNTMTDNNLSNNSLARGKLTIYFSVLTDHNTYIAKKLFHNRDMTIKQQDIKEYI